MLQCNDSDPSLISETCPTCGGFLLNVHLHSVNTFQVVHPDCVVNSQKTGRHDCQNELKNITLKALYWVPSRLSLVICFLIYGLRWVVTLPFLKMLFVRCLNYRFVLHFQLMLSMLHICFYHHQRFLQTIVLPGWWVSSPLLMLGD